MKTETTSPRQESQANPQGQSRQVEWIRAIAQRRGAVPGLEQWMLSLMREGGQAARREREPDHAPVALRDLGW